MANDVFTNPFTRICGIDPGLGCTGYGILELKRGEPVVIEAGVLRPGGTDEPLPERLRALGESLDELLSEHRPEAVAVEQIYAHYKHPRTAILMGHARGVILMTAAKHALPVIDLPATMVKRHLTGSGHASKQQVQKLIARTLGLATCPEPPDVADALAIALCALHKREKMHAPSARLRTSARK
ncbi:MAG: crossover junction endodeoxyribonuclease RuvC [Phycisphaerae bacterium]|nr:crossover junction endodeoxyribonuclease RuvC [Phycisphaerae bacterium]